MSVTTFQKVTLISCSVLCLSLFLPKMLLPRGKKDVGQADVKPGFYPPMMHRLPVPEEQGLWEHGSLPPLTQSLDISAKVKSMAGASRSSLLGQVIPIYGFGILLYILFIFYKMTSKGKPTKTNGYFPPKPNQRNPISEYELARLQQRLQETEQLMEKIVSGSSRAPESVKRGKCKSKSRRLSRSKGGSRQQRQREKEEEEAKLLLQLKDISRVMEEGRTEAASPEIEAEEVTYTEDWDGYPEETYPQYEEPCGRRKYETISLEVEEPDSRRPTPEALAERMEVEEEEVEVDSRLPVLLEEEEEEEEGEREGLPPALCSEGGRGERLDVAGGREIWPSPKAKKQISFNEHRDVFQYPREGFCEEQGGQEEEEDDEDEEEEEEEEYEEEEDEVDRWKEAEIWEELEVEEEGKEEEERKEEEEDEDEDEDEEEDEEEEDVAVEHKEREAAEEDPLMEAESLLLDYDVGCNPEAEAEEDVDEEDCLFLVLPPPPRGGSPIPSVLMRELASSGVRMRNRRET